MRLLLGNGADPKINTRPQHHAADGGGRHRLGVESGRASEEQVLEAVKLLVEEHGLDVNFVADTGETAMHAAAYRGANSVVQYLFDKRREARCRRQERPDAAAGRRRRRVRQFVRRAIRTRRCCCASSARKKFRVPVCART